MFRERIYRASGVQPSRLLPAGQLTWTGQSYLVGQTVCPSLKKKGLLAES